MESGRPNSVKMDVHGGIKWTVHLQSNFSHLNLLVQRQGTVNFESGPATFDLTRENKSIAI